MANLKISQLPTVAIAPLSGAIPIVVNGTTSQVQVSGINTDLRTAVAPNSGNWQSTYTSWNATSATSTVAFNDTRYAKLSTQFAAQPYTFVSATSSIQPVAGSNTSSGNYSNVGGGANNTASGNYSAIAGGCSNTACGFTSTVAGGCNNVACGGNSNIGGGQYNTTCGINSNIAGGSSNSAYGTNSSIAGGSGNKACGNNSAIGGGYNNTASGLYSFIAGGFSNSTNNLGNTFILGSNITAPLANYTYVNNLSSQGKLIGEGSSITNAVVTGRTIYVDANAGTDTRTGLSKYSAGSPFATIAAAEAASVTGDLIYVRAGTYTISSQINLNDEGNLYFEDGTIVQVFPGVVAFSFSQTTSPIVNAISIRGNADFQLLGTTAGVLTIPSGNATTVVAFECNSISGPNSVSGTLFNCAAGALSVDAKLIQMTTNFGGSNATVFNITGTGKVTTRVPFVYCGRFLNGAGVFGAQINTDIWTLIAYNSTAGIAISSITTNFRMVNYGHIGVGVAYNWSENTTTESHGFRGITWSGNGQPNITFNSSAGSTTSKLIRLDQTNIMRYASTNSLSAALPINVATYNTFASISATPNITFKVGSFTVDPDVNNF